jgi:choline dehydrogenase-like flavoprotein
MINDEKVDVLIVGAGPVGSVMAASLAEAGKAVRVLEAGPQRKSEDLYSSSIWGRRLYWSTPHVEDTKENTFLSSSAGSGIGGSALHQSGLWPRFHVEDFKRRSLHGEGIDWPIEYDDLRPYYDAIQDEVGLSGDAEAEVWRPPGKPYPLPPVQIFPHAKKIAEGFENLDVQISPAPVSILSQPYKGRPGCTNDGWCLAGCPIGALANPLVTYIPRARAAGAQFSADCHVTRLLTDKAGKQAIGVEYANADGELHLQPADIVVLAAFTVENVRILLNSGNTAHEDGLANSSGLVGRYLNNHTTTNVYGLFDEDLHSYLGISTGSLYSVDRLAKFRDPSGSSGLRHWHIGLTLKPNDLLGVMMTRPDLFGEDLQRFLKRAARSLTVLIGASENLPLIDNRIELSENRDRYGMRLARTVYQASPAGRALDSQVQAEGIAITKAAGATEAWHSPPYSHHMLGGTIMGVDPKNSVVDSFGRSHDVTNLFTVGPNLFPTISHANPTFTLHALALRSAEHLLAQDL